MRWAISFFFIALLHACVVAQKTNLDFDITAADGAKLKATYYSPGKPGPGILLLHQCNMDRKSWRSLAAKLVDRGIHVLTFDYRGYGETTASGSRENIPTDIDTALATLKSKQGVDQKRLAAGGASCGVNNSVQLAKRSGEIKALLLLTGPMTKEGMAFLRTQTSLPIFAVDQAGFDSGMKALVGNSTNPNSTNVEVHKDWHGVVMFEGDPSLLDKMADWVAKVLQ